MHTIELHIRRGDPLIMRFKTKEEALEEWERTMDNCIPGDRVVLKNPDGDVMSEYTLAIRPQQRKRVVI